MQNSLFIKPYWLFLITGIASLVVAAIYYYMLPYSYFDLSIREYFEINSGVAWMLLSAYVFFLSAIYFVADRGKLKIKNWLVITHFVFVILFLLLFFVFSAFNSAWVRDFLSGISFLTLLVIYGTVFLVDLFFFVSGLIMLLVNIFSFKKNRT